MARRKTADEAIEAEIERLNKLPAVKLAQKEQRLLMARKKRLCCPLHGASAKITRRF